jgi:hypothetical protein
MNSLMTPWPSSDQDLRGNDQHGHGGRHPRLQEVPASELRLLWRPVGIFLKKCVWNMHVNFFWNFHSNVFTLTIWFIAWNMSVEFVLIYRPHPVYGIIIPAQGEFGKWHHVWGREYGKAFFTVLVYFSVLGLTVLNTFLGNGAWFIFIVKVGQLYFRA